MKIITPPVKCQGIKTKIIPLIKECVQTPVKGTWIEPFCGSCVVALNIRPERALLTDTNKHIIALYRDIQKGIITPPGVRKFLEVEGEKLSCGGNDYYLEIRTRFNEYHHSLDFLFLNRSCFNGVMRFNQKGYFNVPFCKKPERFSQAYITKITNQVYNLSNVMYKKQWQFEVFDFRQTLLRATNQDIVYVDPPYAGRYVDYFNSWSAEDEQTLIIMLKSLPCKFLLSTWHSNEYRDNPSISTHWENSDFFMKTCEHFYHVGATEDHRNPMIEALVANYDLATISTISPEQYILELA